MNRKQKGKVHPSGLSPVDILTFDRFHRFRFQAKLCASVSSLGRRGSIRRLIRLAAWINSVRGAVPPYAAWVLYRIMRDR